MSVDDGDGMPLPEMNTQLVKRLFNYAETADDTNVSLVDARKLAQILFAMVASAKMNPSAIPAVVDDGRHPLHARKFAAVNANYTNQSWGVQEERVLNRYRKASEKVESAKVLFEAAEGSLRQAQVEYHEASNDMALVRLHLMMRGLQEFVRPALDAGPLVTLMLAILGDPALANDPSSEQARADAKRSLDVLTRRIGDDVFLQNVGSLIRDYVTTYDEEVGAERRLSAGAAERLRDELLSNGKAMRKLREVAAGEGAGAVSDEAAMDASGETSSDGEEEEDEFDGLPF